MACETDKYMSGRFEVWVMGRDGDWVRVHSKTEGEGMVDSTNIGFVLEKIASEI